MSASKAKKELTEKDKEVLLQKLQKDLPDNWVVQFSKKHKNRVYFFNTLNGERSWKHPFCQEDKDDMSDKKAHKRKSEETLEKPRNGKSPRQTGVRFANDQRETQTENSLKPKTDSPKKKSRKKKKHTGRRLDKSDVDNGVSTGLKSMDKLTNEISIHSEGSKPSTSAVTASVLKADTSFNYSLDDIEMLDLSSASDSNLHIAECSEERAKTTMVILDTNVLLEKSSLSILESLVTRQADGKNRFKNIKFLIPWVVLQELDNLKKNKTSARHGVSFLNRHFQEQTSMIRGQSILEAATVIDGLKIESNDDRILQCCFFVQQSSSETVPVLITKDKNLMNKALTNGFKCFEGISGLYGLHRRESIKMKLNKQKVPGPPKQIQCKATPQDAQNIHCDKNNNRTVTTASPKKSCTENAMLKKSRRHLLSALGFILEKEMKAAFDDLWLEVILRRPPWCLSDVLQCMQKHWLPVFGMMGIDRLVQVLLEKLISLDRKVDAATANEAAFVTWLQTAQNLILGLCQEGSYEQPVKDDLAALREISSSLVSNSRSEKAEDVEHAKKEDSRNRMNGTENVVGDVANCVDTPMPEEKVDCAVFWIVLNQIWTTIISHCGMLFQSLHFVPSQIESAPEVHLALQASFVFVPEKTSAAHALPLVTEIVQSLKVSLEKLLCCYDCEAADGAMVFTDLLETLWTAIQAFSVDCDICDLMKYHLEISRTISESSDMLQRLKFGFRQLCVALELLRECETVVKGNIASVT